MARHEVGLQMLCYSKGRPRVILAVWQISEETWSICSDMVAFRIETHDKETAIVSLFGMFQNLKYLIARKLLTDILHNYLQSNLM